MEADLNRPLWFLIIEKSEQLRCSLIPDKSLKETLDKVLQSGYFDRAQTHQNGTCEEEEEQEEQTVVAESKAVEQPSEPGS